MKATFAARTKEINQQKRLENIKKKNPNNRQQIVSLKLTNRPLAWRYRDVDVCASFYAQRTAKFVQWFDSFGLRDGAFWPQWGRFKCAASYCRGLYRETLWAGFVLNKIICSFIRCCTRQDGKNIGRPFHSLIALPTVCPDKWVQMGYSQPFSGVCIKQYKGQVTQAPITRTKTITTKMHALDWLRCSTQNTPTLIQPIEGVHLYRYRFRSRYRGRCDLALTPGILETCSWNPME